MDDSYIKDARSALESMRAKSGTCSIDVLVNNGIVLKYSEMAFADKEISEDELNKMQDEASEIVTTFAHQCVCKSR